MYLLGKGGRHKLIKSLAVVVSNRWVYRAVLNTVNVCCLNDAEYSRQKKQHGKKSDVHMFWSY